MYESCLPLKCILVIKVLISDTEWFINNNMTLSVNPCEKISESQWLSETQKTPRQSVALQQKESEDDLLAQMVDIGGGVKPTLSCSQHAWFVEIRCSKG